MPNIPALPVNGTDSSVINVTIPAATVPGLYRIIAVADATTVVAESLETNNRKLVSITINP